LTKKIELAIMALFGACTVNKSNSKSYGLFEGFFSQVSQKSDEISKNKIKNSHPSIKFEDKASIYSIQTPIHMGFCQPFKDSSPSSKLEQTQSTDYQGDYFIQTLHDTSILKSKERKKLEEQTSLNEKKKQDELIYHDLTQVPNNINDSINERDIKHHYQSENNPFKEEKEKNSIFSNVPEQIAKSFTQIFAQSLFNTKTDLNVENENKSLRLAKEANWKQLTDDEFFSVFTKQIEGSLIEHRREIKLVSQLREIAKMNSVLKSHYLEHNKICYERDVLMKKTLPLLLQKFNKVSFFHQDVKINHLEMLEEALNDIIQFLHYLESGAVASLEQNFEEALLFVKQRYKISNIEIVTKKS
jgi:hypothetical protein